MSDKPRPIVRYAFYGALFGSLFAVAAPAGPQQVQLLSTVCARLPLAQALSATLIPTLMCTVWAVAIATRWWPLAAMVGFSLGRLLVVPLLGVLHVHYSPGLNVQEAAALLLAAFSMVAAGASLPRGCRTGVTAP